uniref:Leucine rich repeat containing 9 n=1 Tax=Latimeria chalumnae TaxID=7897 RepID=H3BH59_LATCH
WYGNEGQEEKDWLCTVCFSNGLSYETIAQEGPTVSTLEMFFSGYPSMVGLAYFPNLTTLTLVGQNIESIQSLESCPHLKELWIVQCSLTKIEALQHCSNLQKLYLYCNKIKEIENLGNLENLQVLWLSNNLIDSLQGLETLKDLEELNLANNLIGEIGNFLDSNTKLERLNLSGNKICSFKELANLARLFHLKELGLKDPLYKTNPVCLLCNYAIHVLYHMPQLQRLDTYDVSNKQIKDMAEDSLKNNLLLLLESNYSCHKNLVDKISYRAKLGKSYIKISHSQFLSFLAKNLQHELSELQMSSKKYNSRIISSGWEEKKPGMEGSGDNSNNTEETTDDLNLEQKLCHKLDALRQRLKFWSAKYEEIETSYQMEVERNKESNEFMARFLMIELETVGNVRFEEGNPSDIWFTSCYDLILSRFCAWDFKAYGVTGVKINRIIRVHNRILRHKFEEKFHMLLDNEPSISQNYRKLLEYLFYVIDSKLPGSKNKILRVLEEGFQEPKKSKLPRKSEDEAVPLCNSLSLCERPRIEYLQQQACDQNNIDLVPFRHGSRLIIAKVFLGRIVQARDHIIISQKNYPRAHSVFRPRTTEKTVISGREKESTCSSKQHGNCDCSLRQSEWFMFDHELVLPEYVIDFEYIMLDKPKPFFCAVPETVATGLYLPDVNLDEEILNMEPVIKPRPKIISLDEKTVLSLTKANIFSQITVLNLHGNSLTKLNCISKMTSLRKLIISFNEFTGLDDVSYLPNLEYLDASHNHLITLEGLKTLGKLKYLDVRWNQLTRPREEINVLRKRAPGLLTLDFQHNPWQKIGSLRLTIIARLKVLTYLDGAVVTEQEAAAALCLNSGLRITQVSLLLHSRTDKVRPRSLSLLSSAQILTQFSMNKPDINAECDPGWYSKITALNLEGQNLSRLSNLEKLDNLHWASFNNNDLTKIEGLEYCIHLEELSLDGNNITKLEGISKLTKLSWLSINNNQLTSLDGKVLEKLPHLHYLSAENNKITSFLGLQKVHSLIELYIGNNQASSNRDIHYLKNLRNLVLLDLYGNPLVEKQDNYRLFVIFHLPSLKALDGIAVELSEIENAKDVFGGRLTPDLVAERVGHSNFGDIVELDWPDSAVRIRAVDLVPPEQFASLRSVNLERNNLTSFSGLVFLPNIKVLCLNYNHIETILPRQKPQNHLTNKQLLHQRVTSSGYGQQAFSKGNRDAGLCETLPVIMESLEELHLGNNGITNLANLQLGRLRNLKTLFLQGNEISLIEGLEDLSFLQELVLDHNRIRVIGEASFIGQYNLLELHLEENRLRELNSLNTLVKLQRLFLGLNKIQDTIELEKLQVLPSLVELSVIGNPVCRKMLYRPLLIFQLPKLQVLDRTMITKDERARAEMQFLDQHSTTTLNSLNEVGYPGMMPILTKPMQLRVASVTINGGPFLGSEFLAPHTFEDCLPTEKNKCKNKQHKQASGTIATNPRSVHAEIAFRQLKGGTNYSPVCLAQQNGSSRTLSNYPNSQEQESRYG